MDRSDKNVRALIGASIRRARTDLGLTQHEVAEHVGLSVEVYGRYERGQTAPSVFTLRALAPVLRTSADVLLGLLRGAAQPAKASAEVQRLVRAIGQISGPELKTIRAAVELMARGVGRRRATGQKRRQQ